MEETNADAVMFALTKLVATDSVSKVPILKFNFFMICSCEFMRRFMHLRSPPLLFVTCCLWMLVPNICVRYLGKRSYFKV